MNKEKQRDLLLFGIPFILTFSTYLQTVCPTIYTGDSGELAFAISSMGIAHPPGYPLLTLIGKFFTIFIPGNPAYILNILSSLLAASSAGIAAFLLRNIFYKPPQRNDIQPIIISMALATIWGFSNSLWATAVGIEVYSLGILLAILSLLSLIAFIERNDFKYFLATTYLLSLGLANHLSIAALFIPIVYVAISSRLGVKQIAFLILAMILGLTVYLYLPIRSSLNPIADWDHPAGLASLINHITARRYAGYISGIRFDNYFVNLWRSIKILASQFPGYASIFGLIGLIVLRNIPSKIKTILLMIFAFNLLTVPLYDIPDIDQYYLPTIFISVIGLLMIFLWIKELVIGKWGAIAVSAMIVFLLGGAAGRNFAKNNQSENRLAYIYGMNILNSTPQNSKLISVGDNSNSSLYYLRYIEKIRPDLEIYDPVITIERLKDKLNLNGSNRNRPGNDICMDFIKADPENSSIVKEHVLIRGRAFRYSETRLTPHGMTYQLGTNQPDMAVWQNITMPSIDDYQAHLDFKGMTMLCNIYLSRGEDLYWAKDSTAAVQAFSEARRIAADIGEASVHNSLGVFFRRIGWRLVSESEYLLALKASHLTAFEKANIFVNLGNLKKDEGYYKESIDYYNKALAINKDNRDASYNMYLAQAYNSLNQGATADAVKYFEEALVQPGADGRLCFNIGALYDNSLKDTVKAIFYYKQYVQSNPTGTQVENARKRISELTKQN